MRTTTLNRKARTAALFAAPVTAALVMSSATASAAAGDLDVTTSVIYDYTLVENEDGSFVGGVNGSFPIFSTDPEAASDTNLYANYTGDNYFVGYNYNLESGVSTVTGELYPNENLTLGATTDSTGYSTLYADYATDQFAVGGTTDSDGYTSVYGEIYPADGVTIGVTADSDGASSLYGSYTTDSYSVGGTINNDGTASAYAETYYDNGTVGIEASNDGEASLYGSHTTEVNENTSIVTDWSYDLADAPAADES